MGHKDYLYDLLVHDLTGPLSVVATTARSLLRREAYGSLTEQQKRSLERIERNAKKAQVILREILDVSRSEEHLFQKSEFYLQGLVKDALVSVMETMDAGVAERLEKLESLEAARASGAKFGEQMGAACEPLVEIGSVVVSHSKAHVMQRG